ncbi:glycosyltransferase [Pedobacter borealis]|uniref:glycosyltransferase n=1 Tax=Pedobacter borealis TaxID=475254 RepID=UPI00068C6245|nr:glycosyltransferase [Pedobacter borealis]
MKKIVFLAPFSTPENIKEGMMQRVDAVDKMFGNNEYKKTYIIPRFKTFKTEHKEVDNNIVEINLSIWLSFFLLLRKLKDADVVYCHSLYGMSLAGIFFLPFFKGNNFVWDVHGIIPEEIKLAGHSKLKQFVYSVLERLVIKKSTKIIVVTNAMRKHFCKKYNDIKADFLVYPILPNTINIENGFEEKGDKINILYAGNMQGYQNIPLMVESIKKIVDIPNSYFYILTGQKQKMQEMFNINGLSDKKNIFIDSVSPNELDKYYKKAHYGFVLRDDVDVNNVACPTKIIEYLAYGMTCITLSNKIGDFYELGFDFINLDKLKIEKLKEIKSFKNHEIYCRINAENKPSKLTSFILKV